LGWTPPYNEKHFSDRKTTAGKQRKIDSNHKMKTFAKHLHKVKSQLTKLPNQLHVLKSGLQIIYIYLFILLKSKTAKSPLKVQWIALFPQFLPTKLYRRKSATRFLCVKTVSDKVVRHSLA